MTHRTAHRWFGALVASALVLVASAAGVSARVFAGPPPGAGDSGMLSSADEDSYVVGARDTHEDHGAQVVPDVEDGTHYTFRRIARYFCGAADPSLSDSHCVEGIGAGEVIRQCADGSTALNPLYRRLVDTSTNVYVGLWEQVDAGGCPEDAPVEPVVLSVEEFRRLPLTASVPQFQPADGRGLVNMDLIVFTDAAEQSLTTTVLGVPVVVRATPVQYGWDFGDGSDPLLTTDPGAPYPAYTVGHPYRQPGTYSVELRTTWAGQFQVNGTGPWLPVDGTATTTSPPFTAEVFEAHAHLVAGTDRT